jgi:hypothetical protein
MKIATSELEHLREEVKNCHRIIKDLQKKREFVGLTDEEKRVIVTNNRSSSGAMMDTIAKLKEKNT